MIASTITQVLPPEVVAPLRVYSLVTKPEPESRPTSRRAPTVKPPMLIPATTGLVMVVPSWLVIWYFCKSPANAPAMYQPCATNHLPPATVPKGAAPFGV